MNKVTVFIDRSNAKICFFIRFDDNRLILWRKHLAEYLPFLRKGFVLLSSDFHCHASILLNLLCELVPVKLKLSGSLVAEEVFHSKPKLQELKWDFIKHLLAEVAPDRNAIFDSSKLVTGCYITNSCTIANPNK